MTETQRGLPAMADELQKISAAADGRELSDGEKAILGSMASEVLNNARRGVIAIDAASIAAGTHGSDGMKSSIDDAREGVREVFEAIKTQHDSRTFDFDTLLPGVNKSVDNLRATATTINRYGSKGSAVEPEAFWGEVTTATKAADTHKSVGAEEAAVDEVVAAAQGEAGGVATKLLEELAVSMNELAAAGVYDPVVGRTDEIRNVVEILGRRHKQNPMLVGEAGVGKSAIVEEIAGRAARGELPENLRDMELWSLNMSDLIAGSGERGAFEEKLQGLLKEVHDARMNGRDIRLFIDEVHTIMGAGGQGASDAAQILKPSLARGDISVIGATTHAEAKAIMADPALERRFGEVLVEPLDGEEATAALRTLRSKYEDHHGIPMLESALERSVELAGHFDQKALPDSAIGLLDTTAARVVAGWRGEPGELAMVRKQIKDIKDHLPLLERDAKMGDIPAAKRFAESEGRLAELETELASLEEQAVKERELLEQRWSLATTAMRDPDDQTVKGKIEKLDVKLDALREQYGRRLLSDHVSMDDVDATASDIYNVPIDRLGKTGAAELLDLENRLNSRVIGQQRAVETLSAAVRRSRSGLGDPERPIGVFIFRGPTGVGKTEIARALGDELFGSEDSLTRFDMGEFMEGHTYSRLVGSPPGYVGHGSGGELTEALRKKPYSIVLLDEVEKAHPNMWQRMLALFDDGRITDGEGRAADARNVVFVLTTNLKDEAAIKSHFSPELLNRIDEIVEFNSLSKENIREILDLEMAPVIERARAKGVEVKVDDSALDHIADVGYSEEYGARELKRTIKKQVENDLADELLKLDAAEDAPKRVAGNVHGTITISHKSGDNALSMKYTAAK
jgi:ATP-dependent Clp protease ATP-binding subunit ClpB